MSRFGYNAPFGGSPRPGLPAFVFRMAIMLSLLAFFMHVVAARVVPGRLQMLGVGPESTLGQIVFGTVAILGPLGLLLWPPDKAGGLRRGIKMALVVAALASIATVVLFFAGIRPEVEAPVFAQLCALASHGVRALAWVCVALNP